MNTQQAIAFVKQFLHETNCKIIEENDEYITAELSKKADQALLNRQFYWSMIERTGDTPNLMNFTFLFHTGEQAPPPTPGRQQPHQTMQNLWSTSLTPGANGRILTGEVSFGSEKLLQMFDYVSTHGKYVCLYETHAQTYSADLKHYVPWLGVNFKVEFCCDLKKEELHSFGICLLDGTIVNEFYQDIQALPLQSHMPVNTLLVPPILSIDSAVDRLEQQLKEKIEKVDQKWANDAQTRLDEELQSVDAYYTEKISQLFEQPAELTQVEQQYKNRKEEIMWQYKPRVQISVINCGIFHLSSKYLLDYDQSR